MAGRPGYDRHSREENKEDFSISYKHTFPCDIPCNAVDARPFAMDSASGFSAVYGCYSSGADTGISSDFPVISAGFSIPIISINVGAISARQPPSLRQ